MVELQIQAKCPTCGTAISGEGGSEGLCPGCLFELALDDTALEAELLIEPGEAPTLQFTPDHTFSEGDIQGERYRIRSLLGRGGMGEVWRAYDLKLRLDVALKALRSELITDKHALETLRQEVRTAREVISPNVCRVFDLEELDGQELISMEYVDGTTLQEILKERGPLELNEAREIASQFLAGLEAIHEAGLVHRDIKPENLMITRTGRVVVMDFGIAKGLGDGKSGMVAGTPAYMSPEQSRGGELDARADLFSAGIVLAEMVEPGGVHSFEDRRRVWESIRQESPEVSETPWSRVISQAIAADREERYPTASALARALEEVTLRAAGDESARPYPGLSAFQQEDAEFFYGRELEVEALWKKLRRPHLLAVIGPSGAGKSSFLRAGLLPTLTDGWQAIIATPGNRPFANLARALVEQLPEDRATVDGLLRFEEPEVAVELISQWREQHRHGLIILDQFEELFTLNSDEVQEGFAELLGVLPLRADVHVLLSMRDDFLIHCQFFESFAPVFSEMTPLVSPTGASMRRAIVEPALRCGYRFEEESIVEEMLAEVEGERGALPMVAFSAAQLWGRRDRETGLLTREAYDQIGGVSGALAQHAEATLERIGEDGIPIVRELFRNLVTAQGTRAARDREELLSVFDVGEGFTPSRAPARDAPTLPAKRPSGNHAAAETVLNSLIDARLLTSYETPSNDDDETPHHRIEIVHESLLANWPRLVRWRTQDAEGAQLRDELRAQARLWDEHGRSEDYLWTGTAFKEYELWRERYPGGLTDTEEGFARAMTSLAARRRRRRRIAVAVVIAALLAGLTIVGGFWRQAEQERRRAEASNLLALAQLRFEEDPTESLAYTTASLELDDTEQARLFALRALWEAPPALEAAPDSGSLNLRRPEFSPDGSSLAVAGHGPDSWVWSGEGREEPVQLPGHLISGFGPNKAIWASNELLVTGHLSQDFVRVWRIPGGELVRKIEFGAKIWGWQVGGGRFLAHLIETGSPDNPEIVSLRSWSLPDGEPEELGRVDWPALGAQDKFFDFDGSGWWYSKGNEVFYRSLPIDKGVPDRLIGSHENEAAGVYRPSESGRIWSQDKVTGELRLWSTSTNEPEPIRVVERPYGVEEGRLIFVDPTQRWALELIGEKQARLWGLDFWPEARPLSLRRRGSWSAAFYSFHPSGDWIVVSTGGIQRLTFWPLRAKRPWVVDGYLASAGGGGGGRAAAFTPDGKWVVTAWPDGNYRLWPLPGGADREFKSLAAPLEGSYNKVYCLDPQSRFFVGGGSYQPFYVVPLDGSPPRELGGFSEGTLSIAAAVSPKGRLVAAAAREGEDKTLKVWDVETGDERVFDLPPGSPSADANMRGLVFSVSFADESTLYTDGDGGVRRWNLETGSHELVFAVEEGSAVWVLFIPDTRRALISSISNFPDANAEWSPWQLLDLETGETRELSASWISDADLPAWGPSGEVVVEGDTAGIIRVGRLSGGEPHLLLGHEGQVKAVAISPDGQWVVSTGEDNTLRLWPMPDLDKPPFHTLPRDELIAKLKSLTNIRVVRDPDSAEGWSVELDPFPGWGEVPEWQ